MRLEPKIALISVLISCVPIAVAILAMVIANLNGCELNEASVSSCVVLGVELGDTLYNMGMMFWLAIPAFGLSFWGCIIALVMWLLRKRKEEKSGH